MAKNYKSGVAIAETHEYLRLSPFYQETKLLPLLPWMVFSEGLAESKKKTVNFTEWWSLPGTRFAWKDVPDESINQLKGSIRTSLNDADKFLSSKEPKGAWDRLIIYYSMSDAVRLDYFLEDFDLWSDECCRPIDERGRFLESIGFSDKKVISDRKSEIQRRRCILVAAIQNVNKPSMVLYGCRFFEDVSFGETEFRRVFLDIPMLFHWLFNESGIDSTWIPYPIRKWVNDHAERKIMPKRGRPKHTNAVLDAQHSAGWERYRNSGGSKAEYEEDNHMSAGELDAAIDRHRHRK